jgi:crossover junction endodeoxyribonuclease RusA
VPGFEFVVEGPPVSIRAAKKNARRYQRWVQTVRVAARKRWGIDPILLGRRVQVYLRVYYTEVPPDVDNVIKPVLDALKTVVYDEDDCVFRVISEKHSLADDPVVTNPTLLVADALERYDEVLSVEVTWEVE